MPSTEANRPAQLSVSVIFFFFHPFRSSRKESDYIIITHIDIPVKNCWPRTVIKCFLCIFSMHTRTFRYGKNYPIYMHNNNNKSICIVSGFTNYIVIFFFSKSIIFSNKNYSNAFDLEVNSDADGLMEIMAVVKFLQDIYQNITLFNNRTGYKDFLKHLFKVYYEYIYMVLIYKLSN